MAASPRIPSVLCFAALLLGCTDLPTGSASEESLAPQFGATSSTATVALSGAMTSVSPHTVTVGADSRTRLEMYSGNEQFVIAIDLSATQAAAAAGACAVKNNGGDLGALLVDGARGRNFGFSYDKTAVTSSNHQLGVNWLQDGVRYRVKLKANISGYPKLTVTKEDVGNGTTRYTFSGGAVNVERVIGGVKHFDELFCVNQDVVVVDVTR